MKNKNTEIKELIIDQEKYTNLKNMLNSSQEDSIVAFECIKGLDMSRNFAAIAFLRKETKVSINRWRLSCQHHIAYQSSLGIPDKENITFAHIELAIVQLRIYQQENQEMYVYRLSDFIKESIESINVVESVEINIKFKEHEQ